MYLNNNITKILGIRDKNLKIIKYMVVKAKITYI